MSNPKVKKERKEKVVKGTPTAVLVSVAIHGSLILLAGGIIVFTFVNQPQKIFNPITEYTRPTIPLKKPQLNPKQSCEPNQTSERIATKELNKISDIQLPPLSLNGDSFSGEIGGLRNDLLGMSGFGITDFPSGYNCLTGSFYDFKRLRSGVPNPEMPPKAGNTTKFRKITIQFLEENWNRDVLTPYFRAPNPLYASQFMVPPCPSRIGPSKFGLGDDMIANYWMIVYEGKIGLERGGRFRFWGSADDLMFVRIKGQLVLDASHDNHRDFTDWASSAKENRRYPLGQTTAHVGDWFTLKPGEMVDMDLLIAEIPGGTFSMMLLIEEEGVNYAINDHGAPILPIFKTIRTPEHLIDEIKYGTVANRYDLAGGPLFDFF